MTVYIIAQQVYDLENWLLSKLVSYTLIITGLIANWNIIGTYDLLYYVAIFLYTYFCFKLNSFLISNKIHHSFYSAYYFSNQNTMNTSNNIGRSIKIYNSTNNLLQFQQISTKNQWFSMESWHRLASGCRSTDVQL